MLIKKPADIRNSEVTDRKLYVNRRQFFQATAGLAVVGAGMLATTRQALAAGRPAPHGAKLPNVKSSPLSLTSDQEKPNTWDQITSYNNFYEFGTDKDSPSLTAGRLKTSPWMVTVASFAEKVSSQTVIFSGDSGRER